MIRFVQKKYSGTSKGKKVWKFMKDHPTVPITSVGLGVSTTNLAVNARRHKEASEYQEKQLKAMDKLTKALGKVDDTISQNVTNDEARIKKPFFQFKNFSIEEGSYKGGKRTPGKEGSYLVGAGVGSTLGGAMGALVGNSNKKTALGATVGAAIGAAAGTLSVWLDKLADKSLFNSGFSTKANSYNLIQDIEDMYAPDDPDEDEVETTIVEKDPWDEGTTISTKRRIQFNKKKVVEPKGVIYDIDADPRKYPLSVLFRGNVLMMYINKPSKQELGVLNRVLDAYCFAYKKADYAAEQVNNNVYIVELYVIDGTLRNIARSLVDSGFKLNILTGNKFGVGKR